MTSIIDLGLEPLGEIIALLSLQEITALWICGNAPLQWRLSDGKAVRKLVILPQKCLTAPWPPVVHYFPGLQHLEVHRTKLVLSPDVLSNYMSNMACNLQSLVFQISNAFTTLDHFLLTNNGSFPHLTSLELASSKEVSKLHAPIPRTVTNLKLGTFLVHVSSLSLSELPPGLTSLDLHADSLVIPSPSSCFPTGLDNLFLHLPTYVPVFHLIPITCRSVRLEFGDRKATTLTNEDWMALSRIYLISLEMRTTEAITPSEALLLPRTLKHLILDSYDSPDSEAWCLSTLQSLPQNLTTLNRVWPVEISASVAKLIPITLEMSFPYTVHPGALEYLPPKTIGVRISEKHSISLIRSFPPFLQSLTIPLLPEPFPLRLPHTLTALIFHPITSVLTTEMIKLFSPNLRELKVYSATTQPFDDVLSLALLPKSLTELLLNKSPFAGSVRGEDKFNGPVVPSHSSQLLPPQLTSLDLGWIDFVNGEMADWLLGLPRNITRLVLIVSKLPNDSFSAFATNQTIQILHIDVWEEPEEGWAPFITTLPQKLLELELLPLRPPSSDSNITNATFKAMPKSIRSITIPTSPLLSEEGIYHLSDLELLMFGSNIPSWFRRYKDEQPRLL